MNIRMLLIFFFGLIHYPNHGQTGLLAHYTFLNGGLWDGTGGGNDVTKVGSVNLISSNVGIVNDAYEFSGVSGNYLESPSNTLLNGEATATFSAWVKTDSHTSLQYLFGQSNLSQTEGYGAFISTKGGICMKLNGTWGETLCADISGISLGAWFHFAAVWFENRFFSGFKIYINGVESASNPTSGLTLSNSSLPIRVGSAPWSGFQSNLDGALDDIRIYNTALSLDAIQLLAGNKSTIYVNADQSSSNFGYHWDHAFIDLQHALDATRNSSNKPEIRIAQGFYVPTKNSQGKYDPTEVGNEFYINNEVRLKGGYIGNDDKNDWRNFETILSGDINRDDDYNSISWSNILGNTNTILNVSETESTSEIEGIVFQGSNGVALINDANAGPSEIKVTNCNFRYNNGEFMGSAFYNLGIAQFDNCKIQNNKSQGYIISSGSAFTCRNCLLTDNTASGAVLNVSHLGGSANELLNCTLANNAVNNAIYIAQNGENTSIINSILWSNNSNYFTQDGSTVLVINSLENQDPNFVNAATGSYKLRSSSPAREYGDNSYTNSLNNDLDENKRILGVTVDAGAYEYLPCPSGNQIYVVHSSNNAVAGDGSSWSNALNDLTPAIEMACDCPSLPTIHIDKGQYVPSRDSDGIPNGRSNTFFIDKDIMIFGGYPSGGGIRDHKIHKTILSGDRNGDDDYGMDSIAGNQDNSMHIMQIQDISIASLIEGLTFKGGNADGYQSDSYGGAIHNRLLSDVISKPTISMCSFEYNYAEGHGGAIYNAAIFSGENSPFIKECHFLNNESSGAGGAIYNVGNLSGICSPEISNCLIERNKSRYGGGVYNISGDGICLPKIIASIFNENSSTIAGGAIYNTSNKAGDCSPEIINCLFDSNRANTYGGAILNNSSDGSNKPIIINCTFYQNTTGSNGGAIYNNLEETHPVIVNSIFWENYKGLSSEISSIANSFQSQATISFSMIEESDCSTPGLNCGDGMMYNISPSFDNVYYPSPSSFAVNAGNNDIVSLSEDLDGNQRIQKSKVDLGAVESNDCILIRTIDVEGYPKDYASGQWVASQKVEILKGIHVRSENDLSLSAPMVEIYQQFEVKGNAGLTVYSDGCED